MAQFGSPSFGQVKNVTNALRRAEAGASLSLREFLDIAETLRVIRSLAEWRAPVSYTHLELLEQFRRQKLPAVLVINKIDTLADKAILLNCIERWREAYDFTAVLPVSALTGEGVDEVVEQLSTFAFDSPHFFPDDAVSDQPERVIASELVREKMLLLLRQEIPHGIAVVIENMNERETENGSILDVDAYIYCEKDSHKGMVIGKKGAMLKEIATLARQDMEALFGVKVNLQCWVKVKEDWRNRQGLLNSFGYRPVSYTHLAAAIGAGSSPRGKGMVVRCLSSGSSAGCSAGWSSRRRAGSPNGC